MKKITILAVVFSLIIVSSITTIPTQAQQDDETPPTINIKSPNEGSMISQKDVKINWTASDQESGIKEYRINVDKAEEWTTINDKSEYTIKNIGDGRHRVAVKALDDNFNEATDIVNFTVDNTAPQLNIVAPDKDGETLSSTECIIRWTGKDIKNETKSGISHYKIKLDGGQWERVDEDVGRKTYSGLFNGEHTVQIRAVDNAGNKNTVSRSFVVNPETVPSIDYEFSMERSQRLFQWAIIGFLIGIFVLSSVAVFLFHKRTKDDADGSKKTKKKKKVKKPKE